MRQRLLRDGHHARIHAGDEVLLRHADAHPADVAAEIAFLAMDLDHAGRFDLGRAFVDEYVRRSGDRELLQLLAFYKCYRAFVRGKVLSLRLGQADPGQEDRAGVIASARAYFDLAAAYAGGHGGQQG